MREVNTRAIALSLIGPLSAGLSGCYTAATPLLDDTNSVAPYATISFRDEHSAETTTLSRVGHSYAANSSDGRITMRFMATDRPDWYVAEAGGPGVATATRSLFYAVVRVDLASNRAYTYQSIGTAPDAMPGTHVCGQDVCIDDVKAYVASAEATGDRGRIPDATYVISVSP